MYRKIGSMGLKQLIIIIIAILSIFLIIALLLSFSKITTSNTEENICYLMIQAQGISDIGNPLTKNIVHTRIEQRCKTMQREISKTVRSPQQVYQEIGNYLANTAWIIDFGNQKNLWQAQTWFGNTNCAIMYRIEIPKLERIEKQDLSISDLALFLQTTTYKSIDDLHYTYDEYITKHPSMKTENSIMVLPFGFSTQIITAQEEQKIYTTLQELSFPQETEFVIAVEQTSLASKIIEQLSTIALTSVAGGVVAGPWGAVGGVVAGIVINTKTPNKAPPSEIILFLPLEHALELGCQLLE
jgi:hypothetical protein